jgi:hypothetical protein
MARASYLLRQPNTREAERLGSGADEGAGCPGRGGGPAGHGRGVPGTRRWAGADEGAGRPKRGGLVGEIRPYRLPGHGAIRLLELLSGVRKDHPKVVLE